MYTNCRAARDYHTALPSRLLHPTELLLDTEPNICCVKVQQERGDFSSDCDEGCGVRTCCTGGLFCAHVASTSAERQRKLGSSLSSRVSRMGSPPIDRRSLHARTTSLIVAAISITCQPHILSKTRGVGLLTYQLSHQSAAKDGTFLCLQAGTTLHRSCTFNAARAPSDPSHRLCFL